MDFILMEVPTYIHKYKYTLLCLIKRKYIRPSLNHSQTEICLPQDHSHMMIFLHLLFSEIVMVFTFEIREAKEPNVCSWHHWLLISCGQI